MILFVKDTGNDLAPDGLRSGAIFGAWEDGSYIKAIEPAT